MASGFVVASLLAAAGLVVCSSGKAAALTPTQNYVKHAYEDILFREPDSSGLSYYTNLLDAGTISRSTFVGALDHSDEFYRKWVLFVYLNYVGTFPSASTSDTLYQALVDTADYRATELQVLSGPDFWLAAGSTNTGFVTQLYQTIDYRSPDAGGLSYWVGLLNSGSATRLAVATAFLQTSETVVKRVGGDGVGAPCSATTLTSFSSMVAGSYCIILNRSVDSGGLSYWESTLATTDELPTLWNSLMASDEYYNLNSHT